MSASPVVVSLARDERSGIIQLEYQACNENLEVRSGMLGRCANEGGACAIVDSTRKIIKDFWKPDMQHERAFCKSVRMISVDAAPDELSACKEARTPSGPALHAALLPNCDFVTRDKAHGVQRTGFVDVGLVQTWLLLISV